MAKTKIHNSEINIIDNFNINNHKVISVANGTDNTDAVNYSQLSAREISANKKTDIENNKTSDVFFPTTKAVADYVNTKISALVSIANQGIKYYDISNTITGNEVQLTDPRTNPVNTFQNALVIETLEVYRSGLLMKKDTDYTFNSVTQKITFIDNLCRDTNNDLLDVIIVNINLLD